MEIYTIISKLGLETFGSVLKAIHHKTKKVVAIKKLKLKYNSLEECMKLEEVEALPRLNNHLNIIKLYCMSFQDNDCFLVFEYMDINLCHLLRYKDKPFSKAKIHNRCFKS